MPAAVLTVSGKGGTGKTLCAVNLAYKLKDKGKRVACIDADIPSPNLSEFLKIKEEPQLERERLKPIVVDDIQVFSMGTLAGSRAICMDGSQYAELLRDVVNCTDWENVDYFVVDMPPSPSDTFKRMVQVFGDDLIGSVIVMQPAHRLDAERVLKLHLDNGIAVVGLLENMSFFQQGKFKAKVFGESTVEGLAKQFGVDVLGKIPLCHDDRTLAVTKEGLKPYSKITTEDEVLTLGKNRGSEWNRVKAVYVYDYDGEMVLVKGKSISQLVTPTHRVMTIDRRGTTRYIAARNIWGVHYSAIPRAAEVDFSFPDDLEKSAKKEPLAYLFGWYLAEGYLRVKHKLLANGGSKDYVEAVLCLNEEDPYYITPYLDKLGVKYWSTPQKNRSDWSRDSTEILLFLPLYEGLGLAEMFKEFGKGAKRKTIPEFILEGNDDAKRAFLLGYLRGDGHRRLKEKYCWNFTTASEDLAQKLIQLALSIGFGVTFSQVEHGGRTWWQGRVVARHYAYARRAGVVPYKGKVWCLSTENGNFAICRDGKVCFSGNSMKIRKAVEEDKALLEGELAEPIERAVEKILTMKPQRPGFLAKLKAGIRDIIEKAVVELVIATNREIDIKSFQEQFGYPGNRVIRLNLMADDMERILASVDFKITEGALVGVKNPGRISCEIDIKPKALAYSVLGNRKLSDGSIYDLQTAWLQGDARVWGHGDAARGLFFMREVWDALKSNERAMGTLSPLLGKLIA